MAAKPAAKKTAAPTRASGNNKITLGKNPKNKTTSIGNSRNSRVKSKNDKRIKGKK